VGHVRADYALITAEFADASETFCAVFAQLRVGLWLQSLLTQFLKLEHRNPMLRELKAHMIVGKEEPMYVTSV
jgi:hypothetical protein